MSNTQNKGIKRLFVDFDPSPCEIKRLKCEREKIKLPESANDRLKRIRNSLSNPNADPEPIGWKPPAATAIQTDKRYKPQIIAKRQYLNAIRGISQSYPKESSSESQLKPYNIKSHEPISENIATRNPLNQRQQSIVADRLKLNKSTSPYSQDLMRRRNNPASKSANSSICRFSNSLNFNQTLSESPDLQLPYPHFSGSKSPEKNHSIEKSTTTICSANKTQNVSGIYDFLSPLKNARSNLKNNNNDVFTNSGNTSNLESEYGQNSYRNSFKSGKSTCQHSKLAATSENTTNPTPRKISINDRLKKSAPIQNNNKNEVDTRASTSNINSEPSNIFSTTRNDEPEPMEWNNVDVIEVIQNVEQMRKSQKFPPETQTELQHMLNVNNTFAEMYENPREDVNEKDFYIVVDTNVFLSKLSIIKEILSINLKNDKQLYVYIPWMVVQELDYFKDSKCSANKLQANARKAIMLLNECLGVKGSHVKAQLVTDALEAKSISKEPDDIILACCLQAKEKNHIVILLSNDVHLRNKAIINKFSAYSTNDILEKLKYNTDKSGLQIGGEVIEQIELRTSILLSVVISDSLRSAYGDIINQMSVKKPPYTLFYALELMKKYWISVFSGLLQKQCLNTIDKLYALMRQKNYTGLPESEDRDKFVDLTLTLCMFVKTAFPQHADDINSVVKYIHNSTGRCNS